jgi:hypothetical protein
MVNSKVCSVERCGKPFYAHGYCNAHYSRLRRNGDLLKTKHRDGDNYCGKRLCPAAKKILAHIHYVKNLDSYKNWRSNNPEVYKQAREAYCARDDVKARIRARNRQWNNDNPDRLNSYYANRRARKKQAMPSWLTPDHISQINAVYAEAKRLEEETGIAYHVDHIVPLAGKIVCGLHVPWNLRAIPGTENLRRPRIYSMDMD